MKNNPTPRIITSAARHFFYEHGYSQCSMEQIASACGIQKQLITYYFGTKERLCSEVANEYRNEQRDLFFEAGRKLGITDRRITSAAFSLWVSRYYKSDDMARRFFCEMNSACEITIAPVEQKYLELFPDRVGRLDTSEYYDFVASHYASSWFMYHYCRGEIDITPTEFERRFFLLITKPFFQEAEQERVYRDARTMLDNLEILILPDFRINITIRDDVNTKEV